MADETILLDIEFNNDDIKAAVTNITESRKAIDALVEANKKLVEQGQKNSAAYVKNEQSIKALNTGIAQNSKVIQANTQATKANADSIDDLKKRNSELLKERNKVSTATEEGRKKIAELNAEYDKNSKIIADNSTKVEQQRFNIGNYKSAVEGVVPGLASFSAAQNTAATSAQGLRLALGPVGIIVGALVAAFALLLKAFFGTQEGMDKLSKVTAVFGAVLDRVKGVVQDLGGRLFKQLSAAIKDPIGALKELGDILLENVINRFKAFALIGPAIAKIMSGDIAEGFKDLGNAAIQGVTGIEDGIGKIQNAAKSLGDFVDEAVAQGQRLDELQKQIERAEINQITRSKELQLLIKQQKDIVEDETKSYKEREQAALNAKNAQNEALNLELSLLDKRIEKIKLQQSLNDTTREDEKELAELEARKLELQATTVEQGIEFSKKINEIRRKQTAEEEAARKATQDALDHEKKIQDEIALVKLESQAGEAGNAQERADKLVEIEEQKTARILENEKLTASERELIQLQSDERVKDIRQKQTEEQAKEQEDALNLALENYRNYVQGLIDEKKRELLEGRIAQEEYDQEITDLQQASLEMQLALKEEFGVKDLALEGQILDAKIAMKKFEAEETERLERFKVQAVQSTIGQVANLFNKNSVAFKALASAQALIQTYQSAQAVFTGMTSTIPGPVGIALGIAGAAAAVISGLANVAKINSTKVPKLEEGGVISIGGKRHAQGGEDVTIGGRRVANVEQGETMVVLKRGASPLLRNLSNINKMVGGRDFFNDRAPRYRNQDGGFVARNAASSVSSFQQLSIAEDLRRVQIVTRITDIERVQNQVNKANVTSELQ